HGKRRAVPIQPGGGPGIRRPGAMPGGIPALVPPCALGPSAEERPDPMGRPGDQIPAWCGPGPEDDRDLGGHEGTCGTLPAPSGGDVVADPAQGGHMVEGCLYAVLPKYFQLGFSPSNGSPPTWP